MAVEPSELVAAIVAGVAAGFLSGLMGIGGGLVLVPVFHYLLGMDWVTATSASLASMVMQVPLGIWWHHKRGAVDWALGARLAAGGLVGVAIGIVTLPYVPTLWLKGLFGLVMLVAAWRLVAHPQAHDEAAGAPYVLSVGAGAGLISRWLGIGGGLLTGPALMLRGVAPHAAVASSLVAVWSNAVLATILALLAIGPGIAADVVLIGVVAGACALVGAPWGVRLAHAMPASGLQRTVAVALAVAALWLLLRLALGLESA